MAEALTTARPICSGIPLFQRPFYPPHFPPTPQHPPAPECGKELVLILLPHCAGAEESPTQVTAISLSSSYMHARSDSTQICGGKTSSRIFPCSGANSCKEFAVALKANISQMSQQHVQIYNNNPGQLPRQTPELLPTPNPYPFPPT